MSKEYYVIVDLYNLNYMQNGNPAKIDDADKFETLEQAKKELKNYDEDFNGAIYKVKEYRTINLEKMEENKDE